MVSGKQDIEKQRSISIGIEHKQLPYRVGPLGQPMGAVDGQTLSQTSNTAQSYLEMPFGTFGLQNWRSITEPRSPLPQTGQHDMHEAEMPPDSRDAHRLPHT